MSRRLILLRHGQTAWNAARRAQGQADVPLDEVGHAQAAVVAPYLASLDLAAVWSSDLSRARETAEYVVAESGLSAKYDERLREFDVGKRQGLTLDEFATVYPEAFDEWSRADRMLPVLDGEGEADVHARIVPALQECLDFLEDGETGLVVAHGAALKVGLLGLLGWSIDFYRDLGVLTNCAWATVAFDGRNGRLQLTGYNQQPPAEADR